MALQYIGIFLFSLSFLQSLSIPPWLSFHSEAFAFASIIFLVTHQLKEKKHKYLIPEKTLLFLLFLFIFITIQFFMGLIPYSGDLYVAYIYILACALTAIVGTENDNSFLLKLSSAILITSALSVFIALNQTLQVHSFSFLAEYTSYRRASANIGQVNNLGTLLVIGLLSTIYIHKKINPSGIVTTLFLIVLLIGIGLTESRTALLNTSLIFLLILIKKSVSSYDKIKITLLLLFLYFLFYKIPTFIEKYHHIVTSDNYTPNISSSMRIEMWQQSINSFVAKPFFGWGFLNTNEALNSVQHIFPKTLPFTYSHNILIDFLIWFGLPATIATTTYFSLIIFKNRAIFLTENIGIKYCILVASAITIHSLLEYPFSYFYFAMIFFYCTSYIERKIKKSNHLTISRKKLFLILFIYLIFSIKIFFDYISAEENFRIARFQSLGYTNSQIQETKYSLLNQLEAINSSLNLNENLVKSELYFDSIKHAALRYPRYQLQKNYAIALAIKGEKKESERQLEIIKNMHGLSKFNETENEIIKTTKNIKSQ